MAIWLVILVFLVLLQKNSNDKKYKTQKIILSREKKHCFYNQNWKNRLTQRLTLIGSAKHLNSVCDANIIW